MDFTDMRPNPFSTPMSLIQQVYYVQWIRRGFVFMLEVCQSCLDENFPYFSVVWAVKCELKRELNINWGLGSPVFQKPTWFFDFALLGTFFRHPELEQANKRTHWHSRSQAPTNGGPSECPGNEVEEECGGCVPIFRGGSQKRHFQVLIFIFLHRNKLTYLHVLVGEINSPTKPL